MKAGEPEIRKVKSPFNELSSRYQLLLFACLCCVLASTTEENAFKSFTAKFSKLYKDAGEMEYRR